MGLGFPTRQAKGLDPATPSGTAQHGSPGLPQPRRCLQLEVHTQVHTQQKNATYLRFPVTITCQSDVLRTSTQRVV